MHKLKISVAMCTYNGAQFVREQLHSILTQTRLPDEIVICDDKSTDQTVNIIQSLTSSIPFKINLIINKKNLGSTKNFEKAIKLCTGDIIALSDQDDVWLPTKIATLEDFFLKTPLAGAVFTDADIIDENSKNIGYRLWKSFGIDKEIRNHIIKDKAINVLIKRNVVTGATLAFRNVYTNTILPISNNWVHDYWIVLFIAVQSKLFSLDEPLIKYRQHSSQQIGAPIKTNIIERILSLKEYNSPEALNNELDKFTEAYEHLLKNFPPTITQKYIPKFESKISHLELRRDLNYSNKLSKVLKVFRWLMTGQYHKYSNRYASFLYDIYRALLG